MKRDPFPTMGPSSTWGKFDPDDPYNAACERERIAASQFTIRRLKRPSYDQAALLTGTMMATVQLVLAMGGEFRDGEKALAGLHELLDFAWVQAQSSLTVGGPQ